MTLKVTFNSKLANDNSYLLFYDEESNLLSLPKSLNTHNISNIKDIINNKKFQKKNILVFDLNFSQKILIVKFNKKNQTSSNEESGAKFYKLLKLHSISKIRLINDENIKHILKKNVNFLNEFIHGAQLKSYEFTKYKTMNNKINIDILFPKNFENNFKKRNLKFSSLNQGINFTKDLVSEPGNILHPDEYVKRLKKLKSIGLKVTIFDKKKLKKLGMNALLGVGQGSIRGSYLVTIEWNGSSKKQKPLALVGKGVCFDTGGISLKPAKFMEDMTYDMAGSAVVVGLMKTLALRKAKVNAVGVVGLVENMPDGNAQRPGDIVKSYSGKTIEILNTDAEGRLVLADALSYTEQKFKPKFIVDLATLTGAIIVSLGSEYAGLFSNDDKISDQLSKAGEKVGEKVWRMPLNDNYDKLIDSKKADMQNINYVGGAGSTTAAQFLQRFILNKTPWAHLDIAGMAFSKYGGALNSGGATGYGVRLLNQLIEDNYE
ncbi:leucyl aminopeptidase [Candidatus Pelagibacter sp.]|nr:leucyl aminopeptidase [Candidatus Pelagibacter sp.]